MLILYRSTMLVSREPKVYDAAARRGAFKTKNIFYRRQQLTIICGPRSIVRRRNELKVGRGVEQWVEHTSVEDGNYVEAAGVILPRKIKKN